MAYPEQARSVGADQQARNRPHSEDEIEFWTARLRGSFTSAGVALRLEDQHFGPNDGVEE
jgi:hypothetical protein